MCARVTHEFNYGELIFFQSMDSSCIEHDIRRERFMFRELQLTKIPNKYSKFFIFKNLKYPLLQ